MKKIIVLRNGQPLPEDSSVYDIEFPQTLGNPLQINERWGEDFIKEQYNRYLGLKLRQQDSLTLQKLDSIAGDVMAGKQVVLTQGTNDVHGQVLADFIEGQIKAAS